MAIAARAPNRRARHAPNTRHDEEGFASMECIVIRDLLLSETSSYAHVFLPGSAPSRKMERSPTLRGGLGGLPSETHRGRHSCSTFDKAYRKDSFLFTGEEFEAPSGLQERTSPQTTTSPQRRTTSSAQPSMPPWRTTPGNVAGAGSLSLWREGEGWREG